MNAANALATLIWFGIGFWLLVDAAVAGPVRFAFALIAIGGLTALGIWGAVLQRRADAKAEAAEGVSTVWLNEVFEKTEFTRREELLAHVSLEEAWAFARLYEAGVSGEYVAKCWDDDNGWQLDVPTLVASFQAESQTAGAARPSVELERHASAIIALGAEFGITNLRVFGSCVSGTDDADSDINLIGEVGEDRGYFEIGAFVGTVEEMTGYTVDFVIDGAERPAFLDEEEMALL